MFSRLCSVEFSLILYPKELAYQLVSFAFGAVDVKTNINHAVYSVRCLHGAAYKLRLQLMYSYITIEDAVQATISARKVISMARYLLLEYITYNSS